MTTKKAKSEAALAKREKFMVVNQQTGLEAQRRDRAYRERQNYRDWEDTHIKKHATTSWASECPWCKDATKKKEN
jgi:hypothetical protein